MATPPSESLHKTSDLEVRGGTRVTELTVTAFGRTDGYVRNTPSTLRGGRVPVQARTGLGESRTVRTAGGSRRRCTDRAAVIAVEHDAGNLAAATALTDRCLEGVSDQLGAHVPTNGRPD